MSNRAYKILKWCIVLATGFTFIACLAIVIANGVINLLLRMKVAKIDPTAIYIILFLIYFFFMWFELVMFLAIGFRLLWIVRKRSLNVTQLKQSSAMKVLQRPYNKIFGLIIGMVLSAFIQIIAALISIFTTLYAGNYHIIDYFLQAFGVFLFAVFVLLLYNPLLMDGDTSKSEAINKTPMSKELNEKKELFPSSTSISDEDKTLSPSSRLDESVITKI